MRLSVASLRTLSSIIGLSLLAACSAGNVSSSPAQSAGVMPPASSQAIANHTSGLVASPDKCKGTGGVLVLPCKITFTNTQTQVVTVSPFGPSYKLPKASKGCAGYATFSYFDYGMFNVTPGATKGTCKTVFTVRLSSGKVLGKSTLTLTNNS